MYPVGEPGPFRLWIVELVVLTARVWLEWLLRNWYWQPREQADKSACSLGCVLRHLFKPWARGGRPDARARN